MLKVQHNMTGNQTRCDGVGRGDFPLYQPQGEDPPVSAVNKNFFSSLFFFHKTFIDYNLFFCKKINL